MSAILNFFRGSGDPHVYGILKKDDDACIRAFEAWVAKYTSENIGMDGEKKVEQMLTELLEIPVDGLSTTQKNQIGDAVHAIASIRRVYQDMITEKLRSDESMTVRAWYQRAFYACPKDW